MNRKLEDWELDCLADGNGTPELERALASSPDDQRRLREHRAGEGALRRALFRADCPPTLTLGEWQIEMITGERAETISRHVVECPHCAVEVAQIRDAMSAPVVPAKEPLLKRIVLKLESMLDGAPGSGAVAPVALRGDSWSGLYANGDYIISLTRRRARGGYSLQGSLITPEPSVKGQARLQAADGATVVGDSPLSAAATFTFDEVPSGQYELVVRTAASELIVPELKFMD